MKKIISLLLALSMALTLAACGKTAADPNEGKASEMPPEEISETPEENKALEETEPVAENVEVIVFAAASMTETLNEIAELYKEVAPNVTLVFNFDSSGTLQTQIEQGADCDLFISAGQKQMNALAEGSYIDEGSRIDLLENKVTLCVPDENPADVKDFNDMAARLQSGEIMMAMGNSDVPVGQYTQKIFTYYGIDESAIAGNLTYGTNVKEVTTQVSEGSVDCGVIYCTDAYSAGLKIVDYATAEMCGQVIYPAAVLSGSKNVEAAQAFLDYLVTSDCSAVFETVGFTAIK